MLTSSELEEEARKRKERLQQWKNSKDTLKSKRKDPEDDEDEENNRGDLHGETKEFPQPIFRNYKPRDSTELGGAIVLPRPELVDVKSLIDVEAKVKKSGMGEVTSDVDLLSLAPRKPDWDLKRDVEKKFQRLEKRTARAIGELTRERLLQAEKQSLAEVVATTSKLNEDDED